MPQVIDQTHPFALTGIRGRDRLCCTLVLASGGLQRPCCSIIISKGKMFDTHFVSSCGNHNIKRKRSARSFLPFLHCATIPPEGGQDYNAHLPQQRQLEWRRPPSKNRTIQKHC